MHTCLCAGSRVETAHMQACDWLIRTRISQSSRRREPLDNWCRTHSIYTFSKARPTFDHDRYLGEESRRLWWNQSRPAMHTMVAKSAVAGIDCTHTKNRPFASNTTGAPRDLFQGIFGPPSGWPHNACGEAVDLVRSSRPALGQPATDGPPRGLAANPRHAKPTHRLRTYA
jgi:hypothetical protein